MSLWDDEAGYDRDDPKHPDFAEAMFDRADMERKRMKEHEDYAESLSKPEGPSVESATAPSRPSGAESDE